MMTARVLLVVATFGLLAAVAPAGCSSSSATGGGDGGDDVSDLGVCGTAYDAAEVPTSAVPTGQACLGATSCHLDVCGGGVAYLTVYQCDCTAGAWSCYAAVKTSSPCEDGASSPPPAEDGGGDATTDSAVSADAGADVTETADASDAAEAGAADATPDAEDASSD